MLNVNDQILTQPEKKTRPDVNQTISSVEMPLVKNAVYPPYTNQNGISKAEGKRIRRLNMY